MRHVTYYNRETGLLSPLSTICLDDEHVAANTPAGHVPIDQPEGGRLDHLSQRIDVSREKRGPAGELLEHGPVVDYKPPAPTPSHEWDEKSKRWIDPHEPLRRRLAQELRDLIEQRHELVALVILGSANVEQLRSLQSRISELQQPPEVPGRGQAP